jgi:uroporphyrinogen decarboxylase
MESRERAIRALELEEPDRVPMFELEFQYPEEIVGVGYVLSPDQTGWTATVFKDFLKQDEKMVAAGKGLDATEHNTRVLAETCKKMGYDIIRVGFVTDQMEAIRLLRKIASDHLIAGSAGGTVGIPDGKDMGTRIRQIYSRPAEFRKKMDENIGASVQYIEEQADAGADLVIDCTDYCLKEGPFYSLWVYRELIFPYLKMLVDAAHKKGMYYIQHTDGNIWPILDELVATGIDALHSVDPSAGMKLQEVKECYGDKIAICGNVDAATTMAYGTLEQVMEEARQCIRDAAPAGGYFLTTSNCIYKGVPPVNAIALSEVGKKHGRYPISKYEQQKCRM